MDFSLANVAVMNDASSIFRGSHLIASIKHRPYDTVVDSEELLDYSHYDKSGIKMFNETQPFFCDWNYSQHFPNSANILNNWSSYHLASNDDQSSECRTNNLILDRCAFNPKSISESNSLDSWFPDMLKQSPNNSHQSNVSATAAVETDFIGSFVNTLQETPKVGSSVYPFQVLEQQQVESKPNYPGDFKSERTHQCVQCSRYYASIGGLKRHIKVCRISSADSQPLFNSLNQLNTISIPAPQLSSGNNSLPVDLSLVGGNEAANCKLKLDSVCVPITKKTDATQENGEKPSAFTAVVKVLQPNRLIFNHSCPVCPQAVSSEKKLIAHMATHNVSKPFGCKTCSRQFSRKYHLTRHMKQKGCDGTPKVEFPCTICDRRFSRKDNLRDHMIKSHPNPETKKGKVNCPFPGCKKEFIGVAQLDHHLNSHTKQRQFQCDNSQCGKSFGSRATLIKHKLTHDGEKLQSCSECHQCFSSPDELNHHMVSSHVENVPVLMDQQETITTVGLHACYDCDKRFSSSQELKIHVAEHKIPPSQHSVTCGVCKAVLKDWYELQVHFDTQHYAAQTRNIKQNVSIYVHPDVSAPTVNLVRQYDCDICAETFTCKLSLKSHIQSHVKVSDDPNGSYPPMNTISFQYANKFGNGSAAQTIQSQNQADYPDKINDGLDTSRFERNIIELLGFLVDPSVLHNFGWPCISVDTILQFVLEKCGKVPLTSNFYSNLNERLQENAKILFSFIIDDPLALENLFARRSIENVLDEVIALARSKSK